MQTVRCIHHLARSGGTIICRCLGAMHNVCLLSEINPRSTSLFSPLQQSAQWHGLVSKHEADSFTLDSDDAFCDAIELLLQRCSDRGKTLLLRDWSHADFHSFPFLQDRTDRLSLQDVLAKRFCVRNIATVRHPVDHFLSMKNLGALQTNWDSSIVLGGIRKFAEAIDSIPWYRYEDFVADPDFVLRRATEMLGMDFDPSYAQRWWRGDNITGDTTRQDGRIRSPKRKPCPDELWKVFATSEDFSVAIERMGYRMPWTLRRFSKPSLATQISIAAPLEKATQAFDAKDYEQAAQFFESHLFQNPFDDEALLGLTRSLMQLQQWDEALMRLTELLARTPTSSDALEQIVVCFEKLDRRFESIPYYRRLIANHPDAHACRFQLATHLHGIGALDESIFHCHHLLRAGYCIDGVIADYLLFLNYSDRHCAAEIAKEHFRIGMHFARQACIVKNRSLSSIANGADDQGCRKLRVGYVSKDFYVHPVGKLIVPILENHDSQKVEAYVYHDGKKSDPLTQRAESAATTFRNTHGVASGDMERSLREDELDVLVDLGGYSGGGNRLRLFSARCAPLQVAFLGYPATAAVPAIDFRITDQYADPPGLADGFYSERSLHLDRGFLAYQPPEWIDAINTQHVQRDRVKIGAFNNVAKISMSAMRTWAEILRRSPHVDLILKYGDRYGVSVVADRFRQVFASEGICPSRLQFRTVTKNYQGHFQTLAEVDLALDSFPYQGTMTTLETLAVGTPIVSLAGEYYAHRATSAMMMRLGMEELVATDANEYAEIVCQLVCDIDTLRNLRAELLQRFHASSITDVPAFTRKLESLLFTTYEATCNA